MEQNYGFTPLEMKACGAKFMVTHRCPGIRHINGVMQGFCLHCDNLIEGGYNR